MKEEVQREFEWEEDAESQEFEEKLQEEDYTRRGKSGERGKSHRPI